MARGALALCGPEEQRQAFDCFQREGGWRGNDTVRPPPTFPDSIDRFDTTPEITHNSVTYVKDISEEIG